MISAGKSIFPAVFVPLGVSEALGGEHHEAFP